MGKSSKFVKIRCPTCGWLHTPKRWLHTSIADLGIYLLADRRMFTPVGHVKSPDEIPLSFNIIKTQMINNLIDWYARGWVDYEDLRPLLALGSPPASRGLWIEPLPNTIVLNKRDIPVAPLEGVDL